MCGKEWFERITINKSKPSIAQQIILYLYTHKSVDKPENIPHEDGRTTSAITENVGGSPAGVVKALNNLSNANRAGEHDVLPVIKIRPKHGKGRLPGSPPIYYSLTRYGESEALALINDLEFDINMKMNDEIRTQRGDYNSLVGLCAQLETFGIRINVSDKKKVVSHLIEHGCFDIENKGAAGTQLDWDIVKMPSWGEWTFDPDGGDDLEPGAPLEVKITVIAPDEKETKYSGQIKLQNRDNAEDFCTIDVRLSTPMSKSSLVLQFLERLIQRFPALELIFSHMLG